MVEGMSGFHDSIDAAVDEYLDYNPPEDRSATILVEEMVAVDLPYIDPKRLVLDVLDEWDEECGDPDGPEAKPTEMMLTAAKVFLRVLEAEYEPWWCEPNGVRHRVAVPSDEDEE
ncbi:MAG: hypothetical protein AAFU79_36410 [Myxococcota bacterium]